MELNRVSFGIDVLHPELLGTAYVWERTGQHVSEREIHHGIQSTDQYLNNRYRLLNDGELSVRRNPADPGAIEEFPMMEELRDAGATDYIAIALPRSDGNLYRTSWSTDREGGFTDEEIDFLLSHPATLGVIVEHQSRAEMTKSILDLYLGREAGRRVYAGDIRRGDGKTIRSVLFMSDLRGFTSLSDRIPLEFLIAVLNDYFEAISGPIHAHGGEVLKYIGDAVLGIFRIDSEAEMANICENALGAAELAPANMKILSRRPGREDKPRLDFTVIVPAVYLCARLEALVGGLGE